MRVIPDVDKTLQPAIPPYLKKVHPFNQCVIVMTPVMLQLDLGLAVRTLQVPPWYDFVNKILEDWNCLLLAPCTWNSDLKIRSFRDTSNTSCRRYTLIGLRSGLNYSSTPMYWKVLLLFTSVGWENKILPIDKLALWHNCRGTLTYQGSNPPYHMQYPVHSHCFQHHFRAWGFQDYTLLVRE